MTEHANPWYAARLLFASDVPGENALYEERIIVLRCERGEDAARKKARKLAKVETHSYQNIDGETVSWTFTEVLDVVQLDIQSVGDGTEVYHHFLTAEEVDQVRDSLKTGSLA